MREVYDMVDGKKGIYPKICPHTFFPSLSAFEQAFDLLPKNNVYYVFDVPNLLAEYSFTYGDFRVAENIHVDGLEPVPLTLEPKDKRLRNREFRLVIRAVECAKKQVTFLNQFMTFIYSMPSDTHQKPVKEAVCKWMVSGGDAQSFDHMMDTLRKTVHLTPKQMQRLSDLVFSDVAVLYKKALQIPGEEDDVAQSLSVSAYELRYMKAIAGVPYGVQVKA